MNIQQYRVHSIKVSDDNGQAIALIFSTHSDNFHVQNQFMECVKLFMSNPNNRKHTRADFFAMIPYSCAVEFQYPLRFQQIVPNAVRMESHSFGDITFELLHHLAQFDGSAVAAASYVHEQKRHRC